MVRGWVVGVVLLSVWYGFLYREGLPQVLDPWVLSAAALVTAALVPRHKILLGASLALVPAVVVAVKEARSGPGMLLMVPSGPRGAVFWGVVVLAYAAVLCTTGAAIGALLTRRARR